MKEGVVEYTCLCTDCGETYVAKIARDTDHDDYAKLAHSQHECKSNKKEDV